MVYMHYVQIILPLSDSLLSLKHRFAVSKATAS